MLKNYSNNDKQIASKLKKILKNKYTPVEDVDDTNLNTNQSSNESDFLALRIIDNLIRFNQSFRLSQVPIKANMGKYNKKKKGSGVTFVGGVFTHEHIAENFKTAKGDPLPTKDEPSKGYKEYNGKYYTTTHYKQIKEAEKAEATKAETNDTLQNLLDTVETNDTLQNLLDTVETNDTLQNLLDTVETRAAKKLILDEHLKGAVKNRIEKVNTKATKRLILGKYLKKAVEDITLKRLRDKKDDDDVAQKDLNKTNSIYESLTPKKKENVKDLIDMYNSGQIKNEKLSEELEELDNKQLEELLNQFDGDNKFPSSFEALLSAYSLIQNIERNYRDLRPIFNNLSVPVFNDLNDVLNETNELLKKSVKTFNIGKNPWTKKNISYNIDDYRQKFNSIVNTFDNIFNDFQQRKQTFNTNIKTGSGFNYLSKIRNI